MFASILKSAGGEKPVITAATTPPVASSSGTVGAAPAVASASSSKPAAAAGPTPIAIGQAGQLFDFENLNLDVGGITDFLIAGAKSGQTTTGKMSATRARMFIRMFQDAMRASKEAGTFTTTKGVSYNINLKDVLDGWSDSMVAAAFFSLSHSTRGQAGKRAEHVAIVDVYGFGIRLLAQISENIGIKGDELVQVTSRADTTTRIWKAFTVYFGRLASLKGAPLVLFPSSSSYIMAAAYGGPVYTAFAFMWVARKTPFFFMYPDEEDDLGKMLAEIGQLHLQHRAGKGVGKQAQAKTVAAVSASAEYAATCKKIKLHLNQEFGGAKFYLAQSKAVKDALKALLIKPEEADDLVYKPAGYTEFYKGTGATGSAAAAGAEAEAEAAEEQDEDQQAE